MNEKLMLNIADVIEKQPESFDQSEYGGRSHGIHAYRVCNTPCCVAGHAVILSGQPIAPAMDVHHTAKDLLGLSTDEANMLFDEQWVIEWFPKEARERFSEDTLRAGVAEPEADEVPTILRRLVSGVNSFDPYHHDEEEA